MMTHGSTDANLGKELRTQLQALLDGGHAHATFESAVKDFPPKLRGVVPDGLPYSGWQILEHIRIAQRDIFDFSNNNDGSYKARKWPERYWPETPEPPNSDAWEHSVEQIREDRKAFEKLLNVADDDALVTPFEWGDGKQTLLREAFLIGDHTAYHTGELIIMRRLLGAWKK
jgi:hypothetical protein